MRPHAVRRATAVVARWGGALAIVSLLATVVLASVEAPIHDDRFGLEALTSSDWAAGRIDRACERMLAVLERDPGSRAARLALIGLEKWLGDAGGAVRRRARARLAALCGKHAFAARGRAPRHVGNRDRALALLARLEAQAGRHAEAAKAERARGLIESWLVIGPFGWTQGAGFDRVFAPEERAFEPDFALEQPVPTWRGARRWRRLQQPLDTPLVRPAAVLPRGNGVAYLLTQVRWQPGVAAQLRVVADGSYKLWCNGRLVLEVNHERTWAQRVHTFEVTPRTDGWLRLLLKVGNAQTGVAVRVCELDAAGPPPALEIRAGGPLGEQAALQLAHARAEVAVPGKDAGVEALLAAAAQLSAARAVPEAVAALERALERQPESVWIHAQLARALERTGDLPQARRRNDARVHWRWVLEHRPGFVPARLRAAHWLDEDGDPAAAFRALRALTKACGDSPAPYRAAARLAAREGWRREERWALEGWRAMRPELAAPYLALARLAQREGDVQREVALLQRACRFDASARWARMRLARLLVRCGDVEAARAQLRAMLTDFGRRPSLLRALAQLEVAAGDDEAAARLYAEASERVGGSSWDLVGAAKCVAHAMAGGAAPSARSRLVALLRQALSLAPERHELRRELASFGGGRDPVEAVEALWIDFDAVMAEAPSVSAYPAAHTVCLLDHMVTQIQRDGSRVDTVHQVFRIQDRAGTKRYHTLSVPGEVLVLRTVSPDGSTWEPVRVPGSDEVLMPRLEPGAVIEVAYRLVRGAQPYGLDTGPFYFGDPRFEEPFVRSRWDVIVPLEMPIARLESGGLVPSERADTSEGTRLLRWERRNIARIEAEPAMPSP